MVDPVAENIDAALWLGTVTDFALKARHSDANTTTHRIAAMIGLPPAHIP